MELFEHFPTVPGTAPAQLCVVEGLIQQIRACQSSASRTKEPSPAERCDVHEQQHQSCTAAEAQIMHDDQLLREAAVTDSPCCDCGLFCRLATSLALTDVVALSQMLIIIEHGCHLKLVAKEEEADLFLRVVQAKCRQEQSGSDSGIDVEPVRGQRVSEEARPPRAGATCRTPENVRQNLQGDVIVLSDSDSDDEDGATPTVEGAAATACTNLTATVILLSDDDDEPEHHVPTTCVQGHEANGTAGESQSQNQVEEVSLDALMDF